VPAVRVGLMVPCYIDMSYPQVGVATLELLEKLGVEADYPLRIGLLSSVAST
jgi:L-lactate dehydrogenase complex protein LldE